MDVFIGYIASFGFKYAPVDWALCAGQAVPVQQYSPLYALLHTTYGGDGLQSFNLPNLQGRSMVGQGQGAGLDPIDIGEMGGSESISLLISNMPMHTHAAALNGASFDIALQANTSPGASTTPANGTNFLSASPGGPAAAQIWSSSAGSSPVDVGGLSMTGTGGIVVYPAGGSQPFGSRNPYLGINFSIALNGIWPAQQ